MKATVYWRDARSDAVITSPDTIQWDVDATGALHVSAGKKVVATFAPGAWVCVSMSAEQAEAA